MHYVLSLLTNEKRLKVATKNKVEQCDMMALIVDIAERLITWLRSRFFTFAIFNNCAS
jgi:hypothetical protein